MIEKRIKDICPQCKRAVFTWKSDNILRKACVICGAEFEAKRDSDRREFHATVDDWHN